MLVDVGPAGKGLENARARIPEGEDQDRVINELVGKVLEARVSMNKRRVQDVTKRLKDLTEET